MRPTYILGVQAKEWTFHVRRLHKEATIEGVAGAVSINATTPTFLGSTLSYGTAPSPAPQLLQQSSNDKAEDSQQWVQGGQEQEGTQ